MWLTAIESDPIGAPIVLKWGRGVHSLKYVNGFFVDAGHGSKLPIFVGARDLHVLAWTAFDHACNTCNASSMVWHEAVPHSVMKKGKWVVLGQSKKNSRGPEGERVVVRLRFSNVPPPQLVLGGADVGAAAESAAVETAAGGGDGRGIFGRLADEDEEQDPTCTNFAVASLEVNLGGVPPEVNLGASSSSSSRLTGSSKSLSSSGAARIPASMKGSASVVSGKTRRLYDVEQPRPDTGTGARTPNARRSKQSPATTTTTTAAAPSIRERLKAIEGREKYSRSPPKERGAVMTTVKHIVDRKLDLGKGLGNSPEVNESSNRETEGGKNRSTLKRNYSPAPAAADHRKPTAKRASEAAVDRSNRPKTAPTTAGKVSKPKAALRAAGIDPQPQPAGLGESRVAGRSQFAFSPPRGGRGDEGEATKASQTAGVEQDAAPPRRVRPRVSMNELDSILNEGDEILQREELLREHEWLLSIYQDNANILQALKQRVAALEHRKRKTETEEERRKREAAEAEATKKKLFSEKRAQAIELERRRLGEKPVLGRKLIDTSLGGMAPAWATILPFHENPQGKKATTHRVDANAGRDLELSLADKFEASSPSVVSKTVARCSTLVARAEKLRKRQEVRSEVEAARRREVRRRKEMMNVAFTDEEKEEQVIETTAEYLPALYEAVVVERVEREREEQGGLGGKVSEMIVKGGSKFRDLAKLRQRKLEAALEESRKNVGEEEKEAIMAKAAKIANTTISTRDSSNLWYGSGSLVERAIVGLMDSSGSGRRSALGSSVGALSASRKSAGSKKSVVLDAQSEDDRDHDGDEKRPTNLGKTEKKLNAVVGKSSTNVPLGVANGGKLAGGQTQAQGGRPTASEPVLEVAAGAVKANSPSIKDASPGAPSSSRVRLDDELSRSPRRVAPQARGSSEALPADPGTRRAQPKKKPAGKMTNDDVWRELKASWAPLVGSSTTASKTTTANDLSSSDEEEDMGEKRSAQSKSPRSARPRKTSGHHPSATDSKTSFGENSNKLRVNDDGLFLTPAEQLPLLRDALRSRYHLPLTAFRAFDLDCDNVLCFEEFAFALHHRMGCSEECVDLLWDQVVGNNSAESQRNKKVRPQPAATSFCTFAAFHRKFFPKINSLFEEAEAGLASIRKARDAAGGGEAAASGSGGAGGGTNDPGRTDEGAATTQGGGCNRAGPEGKTSGGASTGAEEGTVGNAAGTIPKTAKSKARHSHQNHPQLRTKTFRTLVPLHVREKPKVASDSVGVLAADTVFTVRATDLGEWLQLADGRGWILKRQGAMNFVERVVAGA
mmetsp:Transcript_21511/g.54179  ORF Transcript_21511/g.54179 Transcript_21511/m.54179 type:complete len:1300 (-) Transcript_21511:110-4009(-)